MSTLGSGGFGYFYGNSKLDVSITAISTINSSSSFVKGGFIYSSVPGDTTLNLDKVSINGLSSGSAGGMIYMDERGNS